MDQRKDQCGHAEQDRNGQHQAACKKPKHTAIVTLTR
jgi:hypothetical protein